jgi:hypothetical protein
VFSFCPYCSVSTNHKCFDKPEEMGIEEDNIRKHTTPSYRAPEVSIDFSCFEPFLSLFYIFTTICLFTDCRCGTCTVGRLSVRK